MKLRHRSVISFAVAVCLAACVGSAPPPQGSAPPPAAASDTTPPPVTIDDAAFALWLADVRREAAAQGISQLTVQTALGTVEPIPRVIELDRRQPEFTQTFWRYLDGAVSEARVADGKTRLAENRALLIQLERKYGVPGRFLVAFWGLETNYGRNLGVYPVVSALATLAFDGRRSAFFRSELFDALRIIDKGHITPDRMIGSWAGAMGQTQFMPSTYLKHAIDETGDRRIDVWSQTADALGSGAHYLQNLGWVTANTWGREVRLPTGFDYTLVSLDSGARDVLKPLSDWAALGITRTDGRPLPKNEINAALVLPAGTKGPAFLVYDNFRAILKWNRSIFYALAIGHLADRIIGAPQLSGLRVEETPLARDDILTLQTALRGMGLLEAEPDGVLGSQTRLALRKYQIKCGLPADGFASRAIVSRIAATPACPQRADRSGGGVAFDDSSR